MHVGVIGLGNMGLPIARNLLERGFAVTGFRRSGSPEFVAASPAEVAASADVLLSIVTDAEAVEEVVRGLHGTLHGLRPGTVHIEMSTVDVTHKAAIRDAVREAGGDMLDCPISGSPAQEIADDGSARRSRAEAGLDDRAAAHLHARMLAEPGKETPDERPDGGWAASAVEQAAAWIWPASSGSMATAPPGSNVTLTVASR